MPRETAFLKRMMLSAGLAGALVILINAVVDPQAVWHQAHGGLLDRFYDMNHRGRLFKSELIARGNLDAVILGSSRCLHGIDPQNKTFDGMKTVNACLSGAGIEEQAEFGRFAIMRNPRLKFAVIGLDFFGYSRASRPSDEVLQARIGGMNPLGVYSNYLLSYETFEQSVITVGADILRRPNIVHNDGFIDWRIHGPTGTTRELFDLTVTSYATDPATYALYAYEPAHVRDLSGLLAEFRKAGVRIWLYVSPIHARQMLTIDALGLGPTYERWLGDVARAVTQVNAIDAPTPPVVLYDFAGYNAITTEAVPPAGSARVMRWYWESSHFKMDTGDLVLERLSHGVTARVPADFGRSLTPETLTEDIEVLHRGRALYVASHPFEAAEVYRLVREAKSERQRLKRLHPELGPVGP
jgi:hypothetical protein